ncbi:hypothetical protein W97_05837 [Coniosporium apollinis CBS 100218]|uniref:RRM domain-containing protein n=1 Tax=Coniosporium apollinis (strain CBS 100218) TaxID=1168221 RepID=R7YY90_CONA1|nr:uncharacterized protein W97_05837 [Coniosporium apollinis CBS 100218]EON66591.1 hypothetical protein W97_05837 [Coniosporium apollinis CBS 100218]
MSYYNSNTARSPGAHRHQPQTLHRQASRQFDGYSAQLPTGLYTAEDHAARYDAPRYNDRLNATMHANYGGGYDLAAAQAWNNAGFGQNNALAAVGATTRMKTSARGRNPLPSAWTDPQPPLPNHAPFSGLGSAALMPGSLRPDMGSDADEDLIPTAIVIKNIPFAVKKEQLVDLMTSMRLPLPYAFNYHFDNGVFRGLAFANFTTPEETAVVIDSMNHLELQGRKLRVEYKKMLPLAERERIEREKRERRGQLEEQHRPMAGSQLHAQPSMSSLSSHMPATSPSPVSARNIKPELDLNDPQTLQFYSQLLLFREDHSRDVLAFPATLSPAQRRIVHTIAHQFNLLHMSRGSGDQRAVHIYRTEGALGNSSPPIPQIPTGYAGDTQRRALNRAATTDFSDVRASEGFYGTLRGQSSFLGFTPGSPGGLSAGPNLRAAKSYADLRSYTPSPVPSTASFPATLNTNYGRFGDYNHSAASTNPSLTTPIATSLSSRDETLLSNGFSGLSLGNGFGQAGSPQRLRNMMSWGSERDREAPGPIGGHRSVSTNYDEHSRERNQGLPSRQPRGPIPERGTGFSRGRPNGHRNHGSDELSSSSGVEIVVE